MDLLFWGLTLSVAGKITLGLAIIMVHSRIVKEHHIDKVVLTEMIRERNIAIFGISLMVIGYLLELLFYGLIPGFDSPFNEVVSLISHDIS